MILVDGCEIHLLRASRNHDVGYGPFGVPEVASFRIQLGVKT